MNEKIIKVLDEIFDNFDFEKVKSVMDALDWKWDGLARFDPTDNFKLKKGFYVPTLDEIKQFAANLLWDCVNMKDVVVATGGFRVEKDFSDPDTLHIGIFQLVLQIISVLPLSNTMNAFVVIRNFWQNVVLNERPLVLPKRKPTKTSLHR